MIYWWTPVRWIYLLSNIIHPGGQSRGEKLQEDCKLWLNETRISWTFYEFSRVCGCKLFMRKRQRSKGLSTRAKKALSLPKFSLLFFFFFFLELLMRCRVGLPFCFETFFRFCSFFFSFSVRSFVLHFYTRLVIETHHCWSNDKRTKSHVFIHAVDCKP